MTVSLSKTKAAAKPRATTRKKTAAAPVVEVVEPVRTKRKYTVTPDRPKNKPNTSALALRQVSNANRITGTMTTVYDLQNVDEDAEPFVQAPTDGSEERWLVACHDHEYSTTFHTLLVARRIAFLPPMWCPECAEEVPVSELTGEAAAQVRVYASEH